MEETAALRDKLRTPPTSGSDGVTTVQKKQSKSPTKLLGRICNPKQSVGQGYSPDAFYAKISNTTIKPQKGSKQDIMEGVYTPFGTYQFDEQINDKENSITTESVSYKLNYVESRSVSWSKMRLGKANGLVEYEGYYTNGKEEVMDVGTLTVNGPVISGVGSDRLGGYYCSGTINSEEVLIYRTRKEVELNGTFSVMDRVYANYRGTCDEYYPGIVTGENDDGTLAISYLDDDVDPILSAQFVVALNEFTPFAGFDRETKNGIIVLFEEKERKLKGEVVEEGTTAVPVVDEVMIEEGGDKKSVDGSAKAGEDITMTDRFTVPPSDTAAEDDRMVLNEGIEDENGLADVPPACKYGPGERVLVKWTDGRSYLADIKESWPSDGSYTVKFLNNDVEVVDGNTVRLPDEDSDNEANSNVNSNSDEEAVQEEENNDNSDDGDDSQLDAGNLQDDLNSLLNDDGSKDEAYEEKNDKKKKTKNKFSIRPASRKKKDNKKEDKEDSKKKGDPSFSLFKSKGVNEQVGKAWEKAKSAIQKKLVTIDEKEKEKYSTDEVKQNAANLMWSSFENDDGMKADVSKQRKEFDTARDDAIEPLIEMLMGESERDTLKQYLLKSLKSDLMKDFKNGGE